MSGPKYKAIERALVDRIASGEFAPGDPIPHEAKLAEHYGVTRPTVSRALSALVDQGLIERRRRAGSRVAMRREVAARLTIPLARQQIVASGAAYGYRLRAREVTRPPADVAELFGLGPRGVALRTDALHLADGRPWQRETRWINLRVVPGAAEVDFAAISANEWLVRETPFTRIAHEVWAEPSDAESAEALGDAAGSCLLCVLRTTWLGSDAITRVVMRHPGVSYRLSFGGGFV
jgi:GntR family histidine utilization transcriptional repressor